MIYTQPEVCRLLKINHQTFYKLVREKTLASFRVGRDYRVTDVALRAYMGLGADVEIVIPAAQ